ncbi:hypothetical protein PpBr36_02854 [Pyricularia pennisetigena]|uniref:hypothetical protein n=1 Tax=Pyricularia pennisetigena TaxID=1578925 RepID=UPI0011504C4D|nr:hypothetical protein PpBr36_02854 [Pyricularia pennisetigena]TLS30824.1 hypothetical protein PpBr36_02854 [Pyricularia pennisetigena]
MRRSIQKLASVKPHRYLEPGTATGLAGLRTHGSPRSTLLYLYSSTLEQLKAVPEHSVYRQSVEALTKHRMSILQSVVPPGHAEWAAKAKQKIEADPDFFHSAAEGPVGGTSITRVDRNGETFLVRKNQQVRDMRDEEWDGEPNEGPELEGARSSEERSRQAQKMLRKAHDYSSRVDWEPEPQLTAEQVEEVENKIGAGLIEEVVQVAEGELRLVKTMIEGKVWENLEEQPAEGQWKYFERKAA